MDVPANLTPEYHDAEDRFKAAETAQDQVAALEEMLRVIPKHKGTEKMQAELKKRLSKLRKSAQQEKGAGGSQKPFHYIPREGVGRVVIGGPPNGGKSLLLKQLTNAQPEVAEYPYTTRIPLPGMMAFEDIQIQLVDTPPLAPEVLEPWQLAMIEQADLVAVLFDVGDPGVLDQTEFVLQQFASRKVPLDLADERRFLVLGTKVDRPDGRESFEAWQELYAGRFRAIPFSLLSDGDLAMFKRRVFEGLRIVRVYTKAPGTSADRNATPFVLKQGSTVLEATAAIHKDLVESFKYARIWGGGKYEGQMVERDYVLSDGDLLEVHA